jgi:hypothetical protein
VWVNLAFNRAKKYNEPTGMAIGGMVLSGIAVALALVIFLFMGAAMSGLGQ